MKKAIKYSLIIICTLALSGCSIHESQARSNAIDHVYEKGMQEIVQKWKDGEITENECGWQMYEYHMEYQELQKNRPFGE